MEPSPGWEVELGQLSTNRLRQLVRSSRAGEWRHDFNLGLGDHPPTGSGRAGRPADPPGRAAPAARSRPRPARRARSAPSRPGGRPLGGAAPTQHRTPGRVGHSSRSNGPRIGGRISLNRSARIRSATARTWTTNARVSCMASQHAEVGSIRPSRRAGRPSATRTEDTVRPAPPGGCPAVQTVTGATSRPRNRGAGSRRSGGTAKGGCLPTRIGFCPVAMPALSPLLSCTYRPPAPSRA
jgi:hypothetical protein